LLLYIFSYAKDYIYFLPKDGKKAEKELVSLIKHSNEKIDIAMYSFTNRKILNALKSSARRGIRIRIVADKESNKNQQYFSVVPLLKKLRNVRVHLISPKKGIMHIKLMIIDDRVVAFGSANYTYSAFHNNYEILYINDDWTFTRRFERIFDELWKKR